MYYNVCMKISKTFRLSKEAVDILNKQTNATEYLEALITDSYQRPLEVVPLQLLKELLSEYYNVNTQKGHKYTDTEWSIIKESTKLKQASSPTARTRSSVLSEIKALEAERASMFSQDPDDYTVINNDIQYLWDEYNALKELDAKETND